MIAWWGWIAIWAGLVLLLVVMLAVLAFVLFRKAMRLLAETAAMAGKLEALDPEVLDLEPRDIAVLAELAHVHERFDAQKRRRDSLRLQRREKRLERGKRITRLDPMAAKWPDSWTLPRR